MYSMCTTLYISLGNKRFHTIFERFQFCEKYLLFKLLEGKDKPGKIGTFLATCMLTMMKVIVMTKMLTIMRPNADKDVDNNEKPDADKADHAVKVEKEAEERLAAAAAAEDGEGGGPPPPKVKTRHAKKSEISPCLHFALEKKHYKFVAKLRQN